jgi:hypothetical protein
MQDGMGQQPNISASTATQHRAHSIKRSKSIKSVLSSSAENGLPAIKLRRQSYVNLHEQDRGNATPLDLAGLWSRRHSSTSSQHVPVDPGLFEWCGEPDAETILREGILMKRVRTSTSISWAMRYVILNTNSLILKKKQDAMTCDMVSLMDISKVARKYVKPSSLLHNDSFSKALYADPKTPAPSRKWNTPTLGSPSTKFLSDDGEDEGKAAAGDVEPDTPLNQGSRFARFASNVLVQSGSIVSKLTRHNNSSSSLGTEPSEHENRNVSIQDLEWENVIEIVCGRTERAYHLRAASGQECDEWIHSILAAQRDARAAHELLQNPGCIPRFRYQVAKVYDHDVSQKAIAFLLFVNFFVSILETEVEGRNGAGKYSSLMRTFEIINLVFTGIYAIELLVNLIGHWWRPFFTSAWCIFDLIIVIVSLFEVCLHVDLKPETRPLACACRWCMAVHEHTNTPAHGDWCGCFCPRNAANVGGVIISQQCVRVCVRVCVCVRVRACVCVRVGGVC